MRKPLLRICENKGADQMHTHHTADQCLCLRYIDSTIARLFKFVISSLLSSVVVQPGLYRKSRRQVLKYEISHEKTCLPVSPPDQTKTRSPQKDVLWKVWLFHKGLVTCQVDTPDMPC